MSRVGKKTIIVPTEVTVKEKDGQVEVAGPKGVLSLKVPPEIKVVIKEDQILVKCQKDDRKSHSLHGLSRTLIVNMIEGVTNGFAKSLKLVGTGYRAKLEGEKLVLAVGFSHPVVFIPPAGIKFTLNNDLIKVEGIDKALVGLITAKIRAIRPPESYKGKGIRYQDEVVKLKPGKTSKTGVATFGGEK